MIYRDILRSAALLSLRSEETEEPRENFCVPIIFKDFFLIFFFLKKQINTKLLVTKLL